jgi:hypothetical protein
VFKRKFERRKWRKSTCISFEKSAITGDREMSSKMGLCSKGEFY